MYQARARVAGMLLHIYRKFKMESLKYIYCHSGFFFQPTLCIILYVRQIINQTKLHLLYPSSQFHWER